jgi:hypothetical protein
MDNSHCYWKFPPKEDAIILKDNYRSIYQFLLDVATDKTLKSEWLNTTEIFLVHLLFGG